MQRPAAKNVALGFGITGDELALEAKLPHHLPKRRGKSGALWTRFKKESITALRGDDATRTLRGFEHDTRSAQLAQPVGAGQPGNSSADDHDFFCVSHEGVNLSNDVASGGRR